MKRITYLTKRYLDRTMTRDEWEELLKLINNNKTLAEVDQMFQSQWEKEGYPIELSKMQWSDIEKLSEPLPSKGKAKPVLFPLWRWAVAASVLILLAVGWSLFADWGQEDSLMVYETGYGEIETIQLDDGTEIILNANSKLVWNQNWKSSGIRNINLQGEAYFDVAHIENVKMKEGERMPFKVVTKDIVVNVLGTAFNLYSRRGETDVFLERGAVTLELAKEEDRITIMEDNMAKSDTMINSLEMKPGEFVSFSSKTNMLTTREEESIEELVDWKEGTLMYRKLEFGIILNELEDIYGVQFEVMDPALINRKVSLALPFENWEMVQGLIEVTLNLELRRDQNIIKITSK